MRVKAYATEIPVSFNSTGRSACSLLAFIDGYLELIELTSILVAGFSVVSAVILYLTYLFLMPFPGKSWHSLLSGGALMLALSILQLNHVEYFLDGVQPLENSAYLFFLFTVPSMFFFFSRSVIMPGSSLRPYMVLHLVPITVVYWIRLEIALPILFLFGTAYSVWLGIVVYSLRENRKQYHFELFFFSMMLIIAVFVLVLGFSIPYIDDRYFYVVYANGIGFAYVLTIAALISIPDLIADLSEAGRIRYSASTLAGVDVDSTLKSLDRLMSVNKVYRDENLTLSTLAAELEISGQQLSELINSRLGLGFSRYVREQRVYAAKELLVTSGEQSILLIGLDVGFRSQSNFYAAFKEITGLAPGDYRRAHT